MKSRRSWLVGLALGAALFFGAPSAKAQVPRGITYQGVLEQNGQPFNGTIAMEFDISDTSGNILFTKSNPSVLVTQGIFNEILGNFPDSGPGAMDFNKQYSLVVKVTDPTSGNITTLPASLLWSAPYALNAERVNGLSASATPVNGDLFPVPLNSSGRIDTSILPQIPNSLLQTSYIQTINGIGPNAAGNFTISPGTGITITPNANGITINGPSAGAITSVTGTNGITGGGSAGNLVLGIGAGSITAADIAPGAISGQKITGIAGAGLSQDQFGLLDVNVDNSTIQITSNTNGNFLHVGVIGTINIADGSVTNAKLTNPFMTFTSTGNTLTAPGTVQLGGTGNYDLNLGHTNTWTVVQNFTNLTDNGTLANTGALNETGASTLVGSLNQSGGNVNLLSAGTLGNTFTVGVPGGTNLTTLNGPLTQLGGAASLNTNSNFPTTINGGTSTGNVTIGNNTNLGTNSVSILAGSAGTIGLTGTTNINTGAGNGATSIGNASNPLTVAGSTYTGTIGTTYTLTAGTSTSITAPSNTIAATTGSNNITGTTNVNASVNSPTNINTGTSTGTVSIGNSLSTTNVLGATNINTGTSATGTTIGNASSTTAINGPTNINTGGAATTTIGAATNALVINAPTTHNGTTTFNNTASHGANLVTGSNYQITGGSINGTPIGGTTPSTGAFTTITSNTAGDSFTGNSAGTSILTLNNATGTGNALNVTNGIGTFGASGAPDGTRVVINGQVSPTPVLAGQFELVVNGDAQVTGTLAATTITATTLGAVTGAFDNLTTFSGGPTINVLKGMTIAGLTTASNGLTVSSGPITFSPLATGILHSTGGVISSSPVNLASADVSGILPIANGGTNSNAAPTLGGVAYGNGTQYQFTAAGLAGQVLTSNGAAAPTWQAAGVLPVTAIPYATLSAGPAGAPPWNARGNLLNDGTTVTVTGPFVAQGTNTLSGTTTISGNTTLSGGSTSVSSPVVNFTSGTISGTDPIQMTGVGNSLSGNNAAAELTLSNTGGPALNVTNGTTTFNANNVSGSNFTITGGSISGTPISGSTGSFTTLSASGLTTTNGGITDAGRVTLGALSPLNVGGTDGTSGYFLTSTGAGTAPAWSNVLPPTTTISFANITTGTNLGQTLTLGAGSTLTTGGGTISGTITGATITGSTVNSTPIGGTSPSTGAFTTLQASGLTTTNGGIQDNGTLTVTGATSLAGSTNSGTSTVTGLITANGGIQDNGNLVVTGTSTTTGLTTTNGGIQDNGNLVVTGTSTTTGLTTANGGIQDNGTLTVTGATSLAGSTNSGASTTTGLTTANGGIQDNGTLTVTGATSLAGSTNSGTSTVTGLITANGGIQDNGTLTVTGATSLAGSTNSGTSTVTGLITANGGIQDNGNLTVTGTTTHTGLVTTNGGITDAGRVTLGAASPLNVGGTDGTAGYFLTSTGAGTTPAWSNVLPATTTISFANITTGTNLGQTLTLGAGSTLTTGGGTISGTITGATITASTVNSTPIGGTSPSTGAFTTLQASGLTTTNGGIQDNGNLVVTGTSTTTGLTTTNGGIQDNGNLVVTGTSTTTGLTTANGGITNNGTLTQNGTITQTGGGPNTLLSTNFGANNVTGSNFNITGSTINGTTIGITTPAAGKFTTLESTGNSNIGDGILAISNTFGTAGNLAAAINTVGSNLAGSSTNFSGVVTMSGTNQATDELTINNVPGGKWGERVTANPASGNALGVIGNATSTVGNNATAGQFGSTGGGVTNVGVAGSASGGTTSNVALSATASGTNSFGLFVNSGAVTGINVDASSASTGNGILVSGVNTNANGLNIGLNASGVSNTNSINLDMTNATGGGSNGLRIQGLSNATSHGVDIAMSAGTGINETMSANGTAMQVNSIAAAQGISLQGLSSGTGINISGPTGSGTALNITAPSAASGATGIRVAGDGSASTTAVEVNNGNVRATGANQFAATYTLTLADQGTNSITISNGLVTATSTIIVTQVDDGTGLAVTGVVGVDHVSAGSFKVQSTAASYGSHITGMNYIIINH